MARKRRTRKKAATRRRSKDSDIETDESVETEPEWTGQKLFVLGFDRYVQYDGSGGLPKELKEYVEARNGEFPPYMPLPKGPGTFRLGADFGNGRRVRWNGRDKLPEQVLRYVRGNGILPRYREEEEV